MIIHAARFTKNIHQLGPQLIRTDSLQINILIKKKKKTTN